MLTCGFLAISIFLSGFRVRRKKTVIYYLFKRPCIDVVVLLSPVSSLARYCTQPKVKFDDFIPLILGNNLLPFKKENKT